VLGELGIDAEWRREAPGLWVGANSGGSGERGAKICAFGVHVHRRVTIHGFALNVSGALDGFDLIVPCGLAAARTTSIAAALPAGRTPPALHLLASRIASALGRELDVPFVPQIESPALSGIPAVEMSGRIVRMIQA
jgi:lipoyl(octanoyl) transferase